MHRLRSEFDSDMKSLSRPTDQRTEENTIQLSCGMCGRKLYVDDQVFERYEKAIESGLEDNPLLCSDCEFADEDEIAGS